MLRRVLSRRPSHGTIVAYLALFVALGGSAYAAIKINGKDIKSRTIIAKKLKNDTLTGTEIKESKLGKVPAAGNADKLGGRGAAAFLRNGQAGGGATGA